MVDPFAKYHFGINALVYEPSTNYLDVSEVGCSIHDPQLITIVKYLFVPLISFNFVLVIKPKFHIPIESIWKLQVGDDSMGFSGDSVVKNLPASAGTAGDRFDPWVRKIP